MLLCIWDVTDFDTSLKNWSHFQLIIITAVCDWSWKKSRHYLDQSTLTTRDSVCRVFPRFRTIPCFHFVLSLAPWFLFLSCVMTGLGEKSGPDLWRSNEIRSKIPNIQVILYLWFHILTSIVSVTLFSHDKFIQVRTLSWSLLVLYKPIR